MDEATAQLYELRRREEEKQRQAFETATQESKDSLQRRVQFATEDASMNVEAKTNEN